MKLFTKEIDQKLFDQYMIGNDLENQMVVAKIFNPYGNGVWYLLNSDPSDPDYLWAIVDLFEVEVGSVSREELETLKVPPFRLGLERDLYFTPMNAKKLYEALLSGEKFEDGGTIDIKKDKSGESWVFPNNPQGETYGIKLAAGGMTAGRWYKDNSGQELRYIGESQGKLLFKDGEKVVYKQESDFEDAPAEKRRFGFFEDGGKTQSKRYKVNVYYGGEMEDEEFYTDSLDEAERASQGGEHSEIYDNHKKEFVEIEYAKGGIINLESVGTYLRTSDMTTSPNADFKNDGEVNWVYENSEEWWNALSEKDKNTIGEYNRVHFGKTMMKEKPNFASGGFTSSFSGTPDRRRTTMAKGGISKDSTWYQANYKLQNGLDSNMNFPAKSDREAIKFANNQLKRPNAELLNIYLVKGDKYTIVYGDSWESIRDTPEIGNKNTMAKGGELPETIGGYKIDFSKWREDVIATIEVEPNSAPYEPFYLKGVGKTEKQAFQNLEKEYNSMKKSSYVVTFSIDDSGWIKSKPISAYTEEQASNILYEAASMDGDVSILKIDKISMADGGGVGFEPYGETKGIYKVYYKADGKPQTEIWETKEMAVNTAKRYSSPKMQGEFTNVKVFDEDGSEVDYMLESKYARGGMLMHGFNDGDKVIEIYKGQGIVESNGIIVVVNPDNGTRFIIDLDESKPTGKKSMNMSMEQQLKSAKEYIDWVSKDKETPDTLVSVIKKYGTYGNYAKGGMLTDAKKEAILKKKGNIIIFKEVLEPTDEGRKSISVQGFVKSRKTGAVKIEGSAYDTQWFDNMQDLINAVDWSKWEVNKMAMGGTTKFKDKVQSIKASLLKRKKVSPKVQKDYGKTYSPKEAEESAKRIAGSMVKKEKRQPRVSKMLEKMKKGTQLNKKKSTFKDRMKDLSTKIKERKSKSTK